MPRFKLKEIFRQKSRELPAVRSIRSRSEERVESPCRTSSIFYTERLDDVGEEDDKDAPVKLGKHPYNKHCERSSSIGVACLVSCADRENSVRSRNSIENRDGDDIVEIAFLSDGLPTDDNLSTRTYIAPNQKQRETLKESHKRRKSISDSSGQSESPTSNRDVSHLCVQPSRKQASSQLKGRGAGTVSQQSVSSDTKRNPRTIGDATDGYSIDSTPIGPRKHQSIHAIQIPLVGQQVNAERRKVKEKEDKKKTNFFKEIAQRFKERTISRRSHGSLTLTRSRRRNSSIGCESTKSIAFSRPPLYGTLYDNSSTSKDASFCGQEPHSSDSGMHTPYSFSDSHLDQRNETRNYNLGGYADSISDLSSHVEELAYYQDSRSQSAIDNHGTSLHLKCETPPSNGHSPVHRTTHINPNYESVYKTRSLENIGGLPQRPHLERKRYSEIPTLLEDRILGGIPSPVVEENTPRSSIFIERDSLNLACEFRTCTPGRNLAEYEFAGNDGWPIIPVTMTYLVPVSTNKATVRHPPNITKLFSTDPPSGRERARKSQSRTLEISGPFNPVHVEGPHRPSSVLSTAENMRRYREIFGSAPVVNTSEGKRSRAASASSSGISRSNRWLKFFPMRKAMSEETGARSWEELFRTKAGVITHLWVQNPQHHNQGSNTFRESSYIRAQLNEQLKWLDCRVESQTGIVAELQEYFRRRADVELEYSRQLDKLAKQLLAKHKNERPKREQWHLFSAYQCWQQLVSTTRKQSTDHAKVAEIYQQQLTSKLQHVAEDLARVYRNCRKIGCDEHEELLKILHELHTTMKTYHSYRAMELQADAKLAMVETNLSKVEQGLPKEKVAKSRRYRLLSKERQKRWEKAEEARIKALKARNDYVLCIEAANAGVQKYFVDDLSDLVDAVDFGFHTSLSRSLLMYNSTLDCLQKSLKGSQDAMKKCLESLDSRADKQKFLESNNAAFMAPNKFAFQAHKGDIATAAPSASGAVGGVPAEKVTVQVEDAIFEDMDQRFKLLQKRLADLKIENEEVWKTLETAEKTLMDMIESRDYDVSPHFDSESDLPQVSILNSAVPSSVGGHSLDFKSSSPLNGASLIPKPPETAAIKLRADKHETEDFYLEKFREYSMQCSVIARLQARYDSMEAAMTRNNASGLERARSNASSAPPKRPRRKRIGRQAVTGQPRLFGGSLEEYAEATGQEVPLIVRSCIRVINLFGLHHQGVFRVSGSQVEINNFRESFERGEDPLADVSDSSDINSVAGVLKLYLRELREPLFPIFYFDQLMEISQLSSKKENEFVSRAKDVVRNLPRPHFAVLRYLFAFLNHLSELSDENMMCPWNLAICFGPTLLPIPEDKNPVQVQPLVNELVKGLIVHQDEIFPTSASESGAVIYEKYITPAEGVEGPAEELDSFDASPSDVSAHNISTLLTDEEFLEESAALALRNNPHRRSTSVDGTSGGNTNHSSDGDLVNDETEISLNLFGKADALEAVAQYDFQARHERELSFRRGEVLRLTQQLSADWWRGSLRGKHGLVPDKYIMLNIRDDQREASMSGGEDRASSASSDSLASSSAARNQQHPRHQRPSVDSQTSDTQSALPTQANNATVHGSINNLGKTGWSKGAGNVCKTATVEPLAATSDGLLITAIGSPSATGVSTVGESAWQGRRRSLSPAELGTTPQRDVSIRQMLKKYQNGEVVDAACVQDLNSSVPANDIVENRRVSMEVGGGSPRKVLSPYWDCYSHSAECIAMVAGGIAVEKGLTANGEISVSSCRL
ncbi:SLIT-ROBO Rho GTPase-activating protein 1-like [Tropilaelaps mercedesae]|uniref:SLIT-ROBO Rho GTPase-activating protein 1-like n=1 Tax=Tropilaelaps mercedesae TaxID=418985 RepID=A0A1V9XKS4_9ACAR|nr:SLIT-ROBO Rho GTPase-activating protein 1-like [Tropilaelaps mercedesae]